MVEERENQERLKEPRHDSGCKQGTKRGLLVYFQPYDDDWCWLLVQVTSKLKPVHLAITSVALKAIWEV